MQAHSSFDSSSVIMPALREIAFAVSKLSPVTILTVIPASLHYLIAKSIPGLSGSCIAAIAMKVRLVSMKSMSSSVFKSFTLSNSSNVISL